MKHFTIAVCGRELLSFTWGDLVLEDEFVRVGGDFELAEDDDEDTDDEGGVVAQAYGFAA